MKNQSVYVLTRSTCSLAYLFALFHILVENVQTYMYHTFCILLQLLDSFYLFQRSSCYGSHVTVMAVSLDCIVIQINSNSLSRFKVVLVQCFARLRTPTCIIAWSVLAHVRPGVTSICELKHLKYFSSITSERSENYSKALQKPYCSISIGS